MDAKDFARIRKGISVREQWRRAAVIAGRIGAPIMAVAGVILTVRCMTEHAPIGATIYSVMQTLGGLALTASAFRPQTSHASRTHHRNTL